jgi:hypothetical protein
MKPVLIELLRDQPDDARRRSTAREYLQARVLLSLQDHGAFADWAFVGGTALRFLFGIPRYSEDLDFSLVTPHGDARFESLLRGVQTDFRAEAYDVEVKSKTDTAVASAFVKFRGLLHELRLSPHADEVFSVKVEIDTNPPAGAVVAARVVRRFVMLNLLHYDRASLLAGKLHAVLTRPYVKGRDLYDLAWYLSAPDWPMPNVLLLNNALQQTGWSGPAVTDRNWTELVATRLASVNWKLAQQDVAPFLERRQDVDLVAPTVLHPLLAARRGQST